MCVESIERAAPEASVVIEVGGGGLEWCGFERQRRCFPSRSRSMSAASSSTLRWRDMAGSDTVKRRGELADGGVAVGEPGEDGPARGVGERGEGGVEEIHLTQYVN